MVDQPVTVAEEVAAALVIALLHRGVIDEADVEEMGAALSADARDLLGSLIIEAQAPSDAEWQSGQRRARVRLVEG